MTTVIDKISPLTNASVQTDPPSATLCVLGGALDAPNLGVAALGASALKGLRLAMPQARVICQTWRPHARTDDHGMAPGPAIETITYWPCGNLRSRRSMSHMQLLLRINRRLPGSLGRLVTRSNPVLRRLETADAVLDVAGGDSFSDIYGLESFGHQCELKQLVLDMGKPLVLLPQTIGPFNDESAGRRAYQIMSRCALIATREQQGYQEICQLGEAVPASKIVTCPDMAFILDVDPSLSDAEPALQNRDANDVIIGLNVSGLLFHEGDRFDLAVDYPSLIDEIIRWLMAIPRTRVLLVPHVLSTQPPDSDPTTWGRWDRMSDMHTCGQLMQQLGKQYGDRLICLGGPYTASQTKHFVGQCDFFVGARMHACIGAVSQAVPTVTMAYSKKAAGVMGVVGVPHTVMNLRESSLSQCMEQLQSLFDKRRALGDQLKQTMPSVRQRVYHFFQEDLTKLLNAHSSVDIECNADAADRSGAKSISRCGPVRL